MLAAKRVIPGAWCFDAGLLSDKFISGGTLGSNFSRLSSLMMILSLIKYSSTVCRLILHRQDIWEKSGSRVIRGSVEKKVEKKVGKMKIFRIFF